ncbi:MAG: LPXTG cell wall anchor domain-containing protein [Actinomycetota bacterium]
MTRRRRHLALLAATSMVSAGPPTLVGSNVATGATFDVSGIVFDDTNNTDTESVTIQTELPQTGGSSPVGRLLLEATLCLIGAGIVLMSRRRGSFAGRRPTGATVATIRRSCPARRQEIER